jgi:drug/metabolite transporter (DMT)-like permease
MRGKVVGPVGGRGAGPMPAGARSREPRSATGEGALWPVHAAVLAVAAAWGGNYVVVKEILRSVSPLAFTAVRYGLLLPVALALVARDARGREGRHPLPLSRRERLLVAASGLVGYVVNPLAFSLAVARTSAFSAALLTSTTPLFSALALAALRIEALDGRQWAGTLLAFAGVAVFVSEGARGGLAAGDLLSLATAASFAAYGILNKPLLARHAPSRVLSLTLLTGSGPLLAVCLPAVLAQRWDRMGLETWAGVGYAAVVVVAVGHSVWNWGIARMGVARTVPYSYLQPVLAGVFAAALLGEPFGPVKLIGSAAVLAGLVLASLPAGGVPTRRSVAP